MSIWTSVKDLRIRSLDAGRGQLCELVGSMAGEKPVADKNSVVDEKSTYSPCEVENVPSESIVLG